MSKRKRHLDGANSIIPPQCGLSTDLPVKSFPLEISDSNLEMIFQITSGAYVINGKAGKTAALPNFSDTLTLSQPRGQIASPKKF